MKTKVFLILIFLCICISCQQKERDKTRIDYKVHPNFPKRSVDVSFEYYTDEDGGLELIFENESMGESNLFNCLDDLSIQPNPQKIEILKESSLIKILGDPNKKYTISYSIKKDYKQSPLNRYRYRPIVDSTYFHVLGTKLFMYPSGLFENQETKVPISIDWNFDNPEDLFHSSFGYEKQQQVNISQGQLHNSFFIGGDFKRFEFEYKKKPIYFVSRGTWPKINQDQIFKLLKRTIQNQHNFWKDSINEQFSVSLIPTYEANSYSIGGSALTDSFISYASSNIGTKIKNMTWLYNHELMHKWIGNRIQIEEDVVQYWFSEGFTDYYAYKLMLKYNEIDLEEFINILNKQVIIPHYKDKVSNAPNSELNFNNYWSNYGTYAKLPYRRGLLYAFLLDNQIKQKSDFSQSLDQLMFDFHEAARKDQEFRINHDIFKTFLKKYLVEEEINRDFNQYILLGDYIDFDGKLINGLTVKKQNNIPLLHIDSNNTKELLQQLQR